MLGGAGETRRGVFSYIVRVVQALVTNLRNLSLIWKDKG